MRDPDADRNCGDPESDRNGGDTESESLVQSGDHAVEHSDDHAPQLSLVQQWSGPYGQQLLESVQHGGGFGWRGIQRNVGFFRDRRGDGCWRDATGDGALVYDDEFPGWIPWIADPDSYEHSQCARQRVRDSVHSAIGGDGASGDLATGDGSVYSGRTNRRQLALYRVERGSGKWTELSERGGVRDYDADHDGSDRLPEHAHRVQRQWQLRRRGEPDSDSYRHPIYANTDSYGYRYSDGDTVQWDDGRDS